MIGDDINGFGVDILYDFALAICSRGGQYDIAVIGLPVSDRGRSDVRVNVMAACRHLVDQLCQGNEQ